MNTLIGWGRWLLARGAIACLAWGALVAHIDGAGNMLVVVAWFFAVGAYGCAFSESIVGNAAKEPRGPVPAEISGTFDAAILAALVWFGWWLTAAAWFVHTICWHTYRTKVAEARAKVAAA